MRKMLALVPFIMAASVASAQDANPRDTQPSRESAKAERQIAGEIISTDATAKTLTLKATAYGATGSEKTMTLAVSESVAPNLTTLKAGDKVTVFCRREEGQQRDLVVKLVKG